MLKHRGNPSGYTVIVSGGQRRELDRVSCDRDADELAPSECRPQLSLASVQRLGDAAEDSLSKKPAQHMRGVVAGDRRTDHTQQRARLIHGAEQGEVMPNQALPSLI